SWRAFPGQALLPGRRPVEVLFTGFHGSLCVRAPGILAHHFSETTTYPSQMRVGAGRTPVRITTVCAPDRNFPKVEVAGSSPVPRSKVVVLNSDLAIPNHNFPGCFGAVAPREHNFGVFADHNFFCRAQLSHLKNRPNPRFPTTTRKKLWL